MEPNPVELPATINPEGTGKQAVETHRKLDCIHYERCLDKAVMGGWNSFSCVRCQFFDQAQEKLVKLATKKPSKRTIKEEESDEYD